MSTPAYPRPVVRHIGGHAFRDRETVEPVAKEPVEPMSPMVRRALENAAKGEGLHRSNRGRAH